MATLHSIVFVTQPLFYLTSELSDYAILSFWTCAENFAEKNNLGVIVVTRNLIRDRYRDSKCFCTQYYSCKWWKICKDTNVTAAKDKVDKIYCEGEEIDNEEVNKDEISVFTFFIVFQDQELEMWSRSSVVLGNNIYPNSLLLCSCCECVSCLHSTSV